MSETRILKCGCPSEYQDKVYGRNRRVHNMAGDARGTRMWRCTGCSRVRGGSDRINPIVTSTPDKKMSRMGAKKRGVKGSKRVSGQKKR